MFGFKGTSQMFLGLFVLHLPALLSFASSLCKNSALFSLLMLTVSTSSASSGGRGLFPGVLGQRDDGGQSDLRFSRARQRQSAVEHQPGRCGSQQPQTRPHPGGQRSDTSIFFVTTDPTAPPAGVWRRWKQLLQFTLLLFSFQFILSWAV